MGDNLRKEKLVEKVGVFNEPPDKMDFTQLASTFVETCVKLILCVYDRQKLKKYWYGIQIRESRLNNWKYFDGRFRSGDGESDHAQKLNFVGKNH